MKITVQSIHFTADRKLLDFIQKKADKLDQFYDKIISGEVYLKLENVEDEANKISEIKIQLPGNLLFAKEQCKTFEEATDLALESLRKQIDKHKQKKTIAAEVAKKAVLAATEEEF
ncbi:ribosome hibernation-promoting factor, HPF/YfiA family [Mucilaginibacter boryungensis]|jgi:putative sigma-54 modulation protein|uniref:Ribosome-associated translation inhibitor RaiA n=1 Tax=Mucilaginibacter boryungensis TaxID=768480 RepID=A0ABR9XKJ8_9SPHI|nr:ribosome-associated translation inhibitor RaiA [Mucilaginibacter boryungensis]MBE9667911.1 ribosome-associated translation inhibitor RaiA [Mucilaginibacter boryungensis]